jgi:hypothetical protein
MVLLFVLFVRIVGRNWKMICDLCEGGGLIDIGGHIYPCPCSLDVR